LGFNFLEIVENQLHGTSAISLPGKIGSARGALKVEGIDNEYNNRVTLDGNQTLAKKNKKCC
jgi:hypothetical protein